MALDGACLHILRQELAIALADAKIDKVNQPSREELVLSMRARGKTRRLYISTRPSSPRIHLLENAPENPDSPPMFCMLLRKRMTGGRLKAIRQNGLERALYLDFDCINELGDPVRLTLAVELMGRFSNVILVDEQGVIADAMKRVDFEMSPTRPLLPGLRYEPPVALAKKQDVFLTETVELAAAVLAQEDRLLDDALLTVTCGIAPIVCREIAYAVTRGQAVTVGDLSTDQRDRLRFFIGRTKERMDLHEAVPTVLIKDGEPFDFSFMPIAQYGTAAVERRMDSLSALLEEFYEKRETAARMKQRSQDILRLLTNATDRLTRKIAKQQEDQERAADRDIKRLYGDLIHANMHLASHGADHLDAINYYDPACPTVRVPLNPALSAAQNAARYYKEYRKAQTAERVLAEQIAQGKAELAYLDTVFDALSRATTARELGAIREELIAEGYLKPARGKKVKAPLALLPIHCVTEDGFHIFIGRNNGQNDRLTLKTASGRDWWFHVKNMAGSHVILVTDGREPSDTAIRQAAVLAATHSKAAASSQVPVDYTPVKNVKKPAGAKPGYVIYETNRTLFVQPDETLTERISFRGE